MGMMMRRLLLLLPLPLRLTLQDTRTTDQHRQLVKAMLRLLRRVSTVHRILTVTAQQQTQTPVL